MSCAAMSTAALGKALKLVPAAFTVLAYPCGPLCQSTSRKGLGCVLGTVDFQWTILANMHKQERERERVFFACLLLWKALCREDTLSD